MRRLLGLALLVAVLTALAPAALADPLVPEHPAGSIDYDGYPPLYDDDDYPLWQYTFEGMQSDEAGYVQLYFWMNQLLIMKAWGLKMAIRIVEYALSESFLEPFVTTAEMASEALGELLWSVDGAPLVVGALALTGLWAMILWLRGRVTRSWGALGGTTLILLLMTVLMSTGVPAARSAAGLARAASAQIYDTMDRGTGMIWADWGLVGRSADVVWEILVYEPWLTGQLSGSGQAEYASEDGRPGLVFLAMTPQDRWSEFEFREFDDEEEEWVLDSDLMEEYVPWWETEFLPRRMLIALWSTLAAVVYGGALIVLAGSIILAQLLILFLLVLAPVWLLVALWWPTVGVRLTERLLFRFAGALVAQAVLTATLSFLLIFSEMLFFLFGDAGWMFNSLLLVGLAGLALRYRYAWTVPLSSVGDQWERLRRIALGSAGGQRRDRQAAVSRSEAEGSNELAEPVPAFAAMPVQPARWQAAPGGGAEVRTGAPPVAEWAERPYRGSAPVDQFRSQMVQVRERLAQQRYQPEGVETPAGREPVSPYAQAAAARQEPARRRPSDSDLNRIPPQRPRG